MTTDCTGWFGEGDILANGAIVLLRLPQDCATVVVTLSGTFTATVAFEGSADAQDSFVAASGASQPTNALATTATASGQWRFVAAGYTAFRVRCSAFTSGDVVVTISASRGSAL